MPATYVSRATRSVPKPLGPPAGWREDRRRMGGGRVRTELEIGVPATWGCFCTPFRFAYTLPHHLAAAKKFPEYGEVCFN